MRKILIFTCIMFVVINFAWAEPPLSKIAIKGRITDVSDSKPLLGVNVFIEHTTLGAATNQNGEYILWSVPKGNIHIVASMMGYRMVHKEIEVNQEKEYIVNFELEQTMFEMGSVVVTGTGTPHILEDMPVRTEVITRIAIEQKNSMNLADALSFQTGIRVENNCSNCNFSQVRILGMEGKYSQILVDGDPVVSSLAGIYGLEHFPEEMIDRIEIVKGGGSSLYGGGAIAGVVNLITRKPMINRSQMKFMTNYTLGMPDIHVGAMAEVASDDGKSGAYIFGSARKRKPVDVDDDTYSELGELLNESLGFSWFYQPLKTGELTVQMHRIHEMRRGGNKFNKPYHEAEIAEALEHWRTGGALRWSHRTGPLFDYRVYYSFAFQDRKSYYGGLGGYTPADSLEALSFYGVTKNPLHIGGLQANFNLGGQLFSAGLQYSNDGLKDEAAANQAYHIDEVYENVGFFIQDNLHFGPKKQLEFVVGARVDKHSEVKNVIFSPRFNLKYQFGQGFNLRASVTSGFKAPQTYDEDLHLCAVGGDQRVTRNFKGLKEERSLSYSGGLDFIGYVGSIPLMFAATGFLTDLTNVFTNEYVGKSGNIEIWERVNGEGAVVKGIEFDLGIRPVTKLELRSGLTLKRNRYDQMLEDFGTKEFLRTPDVYGNFRVSYNLNSRCSIFTAASYTGGALIPHEVLVEGQEDPDLIIEKSGSFTEVDLGLSYRYTFSQGLKGKVSLGVKNITNAFQDDLDRGPDRDPAYTYGPRIPRTMYFAIATSF